MTRVSVGAGSDARARALVAVSLLLVAAVFASTLLWAKWLPYAQKIPALSKTHTWGGSDYLAVGGVHPGDAPSWHAATSFTSSYVQAIWKALVAALLISAAVCACVPTGWIARLLNRRNRVASAAVGGLVGTPSLMCTCCTAPVAATLRREGAGTAGVVAYWLGNPLLNPAVLVFLGLVAPWQWTVTRVVVGLGVVVVGAAAVGWLADRHGTPDTRPLMADQPHYGDARWLAGAPVRFGRALARLILVLVPEYIAVVMLLGAFRGWLFPLGEAGVARSGLAVIVLAAVVGTVLVIPTGGEIAITTGLAGIGLSLGGVGALLLTLPAASLPAAAMLVRSLGWRAMAATAAVVATGGVLAGLLLIALS